MTLMFSKYNKKEPSEKRGLVRRGTALDDKKSFSGSRKTVLLVIMCVLNIVALLLAGAAIVISLNSMPPSDENKQAAQRMENSGEEKMAADAGSIEEGQRTLDMRGDGAEIAEGSLAGSDSSAAQTVSPALDVEEAKAVAVAHAGFSVQEVSFSKTKLEKEHRMLVYEIEFYKDSMEYEYEIDAETGEIIKYESGWDD